MSTASITCAICNKPVERVEIMDHFNERFYRFRVWCHGEQDQTDLSYADISAMGIKSYDDIDRMNGVAFQTKRLESSP